MTCSGAVLSGSAALALVLPGTFVPKDLDFYIPRNRAAMVITYFEKLEYELDPIFSVGAGEYNNGAVVFRMLHLLPFSEINIVIFLNIVGHISTFHSMLVMNYVSWYGLICLYPDWTEEKKGLIVVDNVYTRLCFDKYKKRGFILLRNNKDLMEEMNMHLCERDAECPKTKCCLFNEQCAFRPFQGLPRTLGTFERAVTWILGSTCSYAG